MGRPLKQGLDYFPLDTAMDDNFELIEAKYGLAGFSIIIKLYQKIYREKGYYYEWTERNQLLFCSRINTDINIVNDIINYAVELGLFDADLYQQYKVISSHGIQKRYIEATKKRKELNLFQEILLVNDGINSIDDDKNTHIVTLNSFLGTHIKVKQNKVNKSSIPHKVNAEEKTGKDDPFFESFWTAYPRKEGKGQAKKAYTSWIKKGTSHDIIMDRLKIYAAQLQAAKTERQFIRHPATFLNNLDDYEQADVPSEPEKSEFLRLYGPREMTPEERAMIARSYEAQV
jgi:hypothetical protein